MAKGGPRARSGPPPDPKALHRERDEGDWIVLPAEGRVGDPPEWPLHRPNQRELDLWADEWRRPQAIMWERQGQAVEVAMYVRSLVAAESRTATAAARTLLIRQMEALGISVPGMLRNRWRIAGPWIARPSGPAPEGGPQPETPAPSSGRTGARDRLRVVPGGA